MARMTLGGREGSITVSAKLETSEPGALAFLLTVGCEIIPDVRLDPSRLEFTGIKSNETLTAECQVITASAIDSSKSAERVMYTIVNPGISIEPLDVNPAEGLFNRLERTVHRFRITIDTEKLDRANGRSALREAVVFHAPQGNETVPLPLPISIAFRHHDHLIGPSTMALRRQHPEGHVLQLKTHDGTPFIVTSARASLEEVVVQPQGGGAASEQSIQIGFFDTSQSVSKPSITTVGGIQKCTLTLLTDRWPNKPYEVEVLLLP